MANTEDNAPLHNDDERPGTAAALVVIAVPICLLILVLAMVFGKEMIH